MRQVITAIFLFFIASSAHAACSPDQLLSATKVRLMLGEMIDGAEASGDALIVKWGRDFDLWTPDQRRKMITAFADTDACITGKPRMIEFYRSGARVGQASPRTGITLE